MRCADGLSDEAVAGDLEVCAHTVRRWRERPGRDRFAGLTDAPRREAPRRIDDIAVAAVVTPHPGTGAGRGDALEHALDGQSERAFGVDSRSDLARAFGLQPHRGETFKLSSDQAFVEKARDIVGLYLNPRSHRRALRR
jgi:hypothetical protein